MVACVRGLDDIAKYRRFRLLRPLNSVHQGARAWWLYAARCHGYRYINAERRREIGRENLKYIQIYSRIIVNPNETLSQEQKEFKDNVEKDRTFEDLQFLREVCHNEHLFYHIN